MDCSDPLRFWKLAASTYIVGSKQNHGARKSQRLQRHAMGGRLAGRGSAPATAIQSTLVPSQLAIPTHDPWASDCKNSGCKLRSDIIFKDLCDGFDGRRFQLLHRMRKCVGADSRVDIVFFHTEAMAAVVGVGVPFGVVQVPLAQGSKVCGNRTVRVVEWREEDWKKLWLLYPEAHSDLEAQGFNPLLVDLEESDQSAAATAVHPGGQQRVDITIDVVTSLIQLQGHGRRSQDLQNDVVEQEQLTGPPGTNPESTVTSRPHTGGTGTGSGVASSSTGIVTGQPTGQEPGRNPGSPDGVVHVTVGETTDALSRVTMSSGPAPLAYTPTKMRVEVVLQRVCKGEGLDLRALDGNLKSLLGLADDGQPQPQQPTPAKPKPNKWRQLFRPLRPASTSAQAAASTNLNCLDLEGLRRIVFDCCIDPLLTITFIADTNQVEIEVRVGGDFQLHREISDDPRVGPGCAHDHLRVSFEPVSDLGHRNCMVPLRMKNDSQRVDPELVYAPAHTTSQASSTTGGSSWNFGGDVGGSAGPVSLRGGVSHTRSKGETTTETTQTTDTCGTRLKESSNFDVRRYSVGDKLVFKAEHNPPIASPGLKVQYESFKKWNRETANSKLAVLAAYEPSNGCSGSSDSFAKYKLELSREMYVYIRTSSAKSSGLSTFSQKFQKELLVNHALPLAPITSAGFSRSANGHSQVRWSPAFPHDDDMVSDMKKYVREVIPGELEEDRIKTRKGAHEHGQSRRSLETQAVRRREEERRRSREAQAQRSQEEQALRSRQEERRQEEGRACGGNP